MIEQGAVLDRTRRATQPRRRSALAATLTGIAIAGIFLLLPVAQAATASPPTILLKAPYSGVTVSPSTSTSTSGCASGKVIRAPSFSAATGSTRFSVKASASSCPGPFGDSGAASAGLTLLVPIPVYSGNDVIHAKMTVDASLAARIGGANCLLFNLSFSYCYSSASAYLYGYAYLIDETSGFYYSSTSYWPGVDAYSSLYVSCYVGNCSVNLTAPMHITVSAPVSWTFDAAGLNAAHLFVLEVDLYSSVSAYDYAYDASFTGASEFANVLMSGPGLGATLNSITIR